MTDLIRQNLEKSILVLRILCLAFTIITVRRVVSAEETCNVVGFAENDQQRLCSHRGKNIFNRPVCCVAIECPKGNEAALCAKSDPASTACVECKPGTYQPSSFQSCYAHLYQCKRHTVCTEDSRVLLNGSSTSDTVCECRLELGFYGIWPDCHKDKTCGPGLQLRQDGSCEICPQNFHKASDGVKQCVPCSVCDKSIQNSQRNCTATENTVCSNNSISETGGVSIDDNVGVPVETVLIPVLVIAVVVMIVVVVVLIALFCYKVTYKDKAREQVGPSSTSTSESSDISVSQGAENFPRVETKALLIDQKEGPINIVGRCGVKHFEHRDASLSHIASQIELNQQTPFLPPEHTFDLRETEDVTYEVEVENSERHRAHQIPKTNVNMKGKMNIYGDYVVININNKDSDIT